MSYNSFFIKVVFLGDSGSGKTSIICRIGDEPSDYLPFVYGSAVFQTKYDNVNMCPWDTPGSAEFERKRVLQYPHTNCVVLCFSISDRDSYNSCLNLWYPEISLFLPKVPIILVGTKSDHYNHPNYKKDHLITHKEGLELANKINAVEYIETSSLNKTNIEKIKEVVLIVSILNKNNKNNKDRDLSLLSPKKFKSTSSYSFKAPGDNDEKESKCKIN
ncbi:racR, RHO family GTPase [Dictyostelium purpureum]|uniref:RacR, RHO family GTPase n=1 Tax=Dictyostelium purpureum TaxID=5786 RepID=F0ZQ55_DICPU|nr:racR, RHO family GTPase [Dictyostelium purpureum]EGC33910.1 racR, RHO family GTPase [Dictyostelium purpureum]|eukprot:XP_003289545.1 racR, RHO family GTPase [Dictyostelium purpureum]